MRRLLRPVAHRYRNWMDRWETDLCYRATDRIVRPFDYGLEWSRKWPSATGLSPGDDPVEYIKEVNRRSIVNSSEFFGYRPPASFDLKDNWLSFESPVRTPYPENDVVRALWFPAKSNPRKAVVVLPHWNSKLPQHNALCAGLQRLGISALRLSLPYHDQRTPAGMSRADFAMSSNLCRTIDAAREAVIDVRSCFDWLQQQGFTKLGIIGTSIGSCYAFLASAHDDRIQVNCFNHCSTYVADVVWEGLSTRHVRESLESAIDLPTLREIWACISPPNYWDLFTQGRKRSKFIYTRYDTTFPLHLSRQVIEGARRHNWDHDVAVLPCGHYTQGEFPFKYITGYEICSYMKRNL